MAKSDTPKSTRDKLLESSLDIFGRYGFEGATTRDLAQAAGVNQQAILYHFGSKQGLYLAVTDYLIGLIEAFATPLRVKVQQAFEEAQQKGQAVTADQATKLLCAMTDNIVELFANPSVATWSRFIIREQLEPTEAFGRLYDNYIKGMLEILSRLVAIIMGRSVDETVKIRTVALFGSLLVFHVGRAAILAQTGWKTIGVNERQTIKDNVAQMIAAMKQDD